MNQQQLEVLCGEVNQLCRETGSFFLSEIHKVEAEDIETKGLHNFVSYVDKTAEKQLVERLSLLLPGSGFIAEEGSASFSNERYRWIIDPLDGTTNFLHRIPLYSISIALQEGEETILGVVYEPNLKECFYSWKNAPAFLNETEIHVSAVNSMGSSLLATGFPYTDYGRMKEYIDLFMYFARNTSGLRRLGSAAVDLAYSACGRFEGFYEYGLQPWDVAGGAFLVQQAGGKVTDFEGGNKFIFGGELLASNRLMHNEFLEAVQQHFHNIRRS